VDSGEHSKRRPTMFVQRFRDLGGTRSTPVTCVVGLLHPIGEPRPE
jgi:hypothetical protein